MPPGNAKHVWAISLPHRSMVSYLMLHYPSPTTGDSIPETWSYLSHITLIHIKFCPVRFDPTFDPHIIKILKLIVP